MDDPNIFTHILQFSSIFSNKQKVQHSANMNVLGAYIFFHVIIKPLKPGKSESTQNYGSNAI